MVLSIGRLYAKVKDYAEENYYTQNQGLANSQWYGKGAAILSLNNQVSTVENITMPIRDWTIKEILYVKDSQAKNIIQAEI